MSFTPFIGGEERVTSDGHRITAMPATRERYRAVNAPASHKLRVAAYARVSTDNEEQATSYEAQVDYYTRYIKSREDWIYCGMYADEGISATSTAKRGQFKQMIVDALDGKFDRILTKSVSRFARNTVDSLTTIRKLKEKGVGVTFEKENIDTLDSKGELLITLMSSLAQEESRSISENTTWGQRKRFADGKATVPFSRFLGYDRGENGEMLVNEEEAKTVRLIYKLFLDGKSIAAISRHLMKAGIPAPGGGQTWQTTTLESILTNEKYRGDALLQKTFTVDFLSKKMKRNEGEVPSYYVENSHPAIVDGEVFELVQSELCRRKESGRRICSGHVFAGKLVCGECGGLYGSKVWGSNTKYRKVVWQCNNKYGRYVKKATEDDVAEKSGITIGATHCATPHLTDEQIKDAFISMVNEMLERKDEIITFYDDLLAQITDTTALEGEREKCLSEHGKLNTEFDDWAKQHARHPMPQDVYEAHSIELTAAIDAVKGKIMKLDSEMTKRKAKRANAENILRRLRVEGPITAFDEGMFGALVDAVTVYSGRVVFRLKDGNEREIGI